MKTRIRISSSIAVAAFLSSVAPAQLYPDLTVTRCSVSPTLVAPGQVVAVDYDVCNVGQWGTGTNWTDAVLFNSSPSLNGAIVLVTTQRFFPNFILPAQCYSTWPGNNLTHFVSIPGGLTRGTYWVGYSCNHFRAPWPFPEQNYLNNVCWSSIFVDGPPDLVVDTCTVSEDVWQPGLAVRFEAVVRNQGGDLRNGSARLGLYVSPDTQPRGAAVATFAPLVIPGGGSTRVTIPFTVPSLGNGRYRLVAWIDDLRLVAETDEDNNTCAIAVAVAPRARFTRFGAGCSGRGYAIPEIGAEGLPTLGNPTFAITGSSMLPSSLAALVLDRQYTQGFDLGVLGMSGCFLYVTAPTLVFAGGTNTQGTIRVDFAVPDDEALLGGEGTAQWLVLSPGANALGVLASGGGEMLFGR